MNWKNSIRVILRGTLVSLAVAGLLGMAAFLPGSVEGSYNNFLITCMCNGRNIVNMRDNRMVTYHANHQPAEMLGSYVTRKDGVVEFYLMPGLSRGDDQPMMRAYPYLLITKFVDEEDGNVRWQWKLPAIGEIASMVRDQEIIEDVPARKGQQKRKVYDRDFKLLRHEAKERRNPWKQVAGDEVPLIVYSAHRPYPDSTLPRGAGKRLPGREFQQVIYREYDLREKLMETEISQAGFEKMVDEALPHDSSVDSLYREHMDLILGVANRLYLVEYESGEVNGAGPEGDRFRITPLSGMTSGDWPIGTSYDDEILELLRKATAYHRESRK